MNEVCNQQDCPLYGIYFNPESYEEFRKINEKIRKSENIESITAWTVTMLQAENRYMQLCSSCIHFNKPDVRAILIAKHAKGLLNEV